MTRWRFFYKMAPWTPPVTLKHRSLASLNTSFSGSIEIHKSFHNTYKWRHRHDHRLPRVPLCCTMYDVPTDPTSTSRDWLLTLTNDITGAELDPECTWTRWYICHQSTKTTSRAASNKNLRCSRHFWQTLAGKCSNVDGMSLPEKVS